MKFFHSGPLMNAEMLVVMLEKHGIAAPQEFRTGAHRCGDLSRVAKVFVPEADHDRGLRF